MAFPGPYYHAKPISNARSPGAPESRPHRTARARARCDALAGRGIFLVQHDDAGRDAVAVKQVGRQADDAFDIALPDDALADYAFGPAPEQHTVGVDDRALAGALKLSQAAVA